MFLFDCIPKKPLNPNQNQILFLLSDYKVTGRDSLVFLVDASKEMFVKGEDGQPSNFDLSMQVRGPCSVDVVAHSIMSL